MDFSLSDEQTMLQDSVARFIDNDYDFETRQKLAASDRGFSDSLWQQFAELGWTAVPFSEADGGLDGGAVETMLIMEQFGRGLVLEPYLASVVLAGGVLRRAASPAQRERWLPALIDGSQIATLAFAEPQSRYRLDDVVTSAARDGDDFVLNGHKAVVLAGDSADLLIVSARTSGTQHSPEGLTLFAIPADAPGLSRRAYPTVDGLRAAEITLTDVRVHADDVLGDIDAGGPVLSAAVDDGALAVSAEALGIMQKLNEKTLDYTRSRVQFGTPIAAFQALQHRMVDMFMDAEQSRSLLYWAVMSADADDATARAVAVSAMKYQVGSAGRKLGQEAVQLHGGMGVTWELDVAHYFKRLTSIDTLFGNADYHLERFITLGG